MLIAPCFDKKLEGAREEMKSKRAPINLVLSSEEICQFILDRKFDLFNNVPDAHYTLLTSKKVISDIIANFNQLNQQNVRNSILALENNPNFQITRSYSVFGTSNGYLDYILNKLQKKQNYKSIKTSHRKNKNHQDITLEFEGESEIIFGLVYGFKNIQNLVTQIKTKKCKYVYCEIMACPSGCVSGGGQPRFDGQNTTNLIADWVSTDLKKDIVRNQEIVEQFCKLFRNGKLIDVLSSEFMHYKYEAIAKKDGLKEDW